MTFDRVDEVCLLLLRDGLDEQPTDMAVLQALDPEEAGQVFVSMMGLALGGIRAIAGNRSCSPRDVLDDLEARMRAKPFL